MIIFYDVTSKKAISYSLDTLLPEGGVEALPEGQAYVADEERSAFIQYLKYVTVDDTVLEAKEVSYPLNVQDLILAENLEKYKEEKKREVGSWLKDKFEEGVEHTFPNGDVDVVQTRNPDDIVAIQGLVSRAMYEENFNNVGFTDTFRAKSNKNYTLGILDIYTLSNVVNSFVSASRLASWTAKDAITSATNIAEVDAAVALLEG